MPASSSINLGTNGGLTIECWINPVDVNTPHVIAEWNNGNSTVGMQFWTSVVPYYGDPGSIFANLVDSFGNSHILTSPAGVLTANQFQHVAVTYDQASGIGSVYVNGVVVVSQNIGSVQLSTWYDLYIGKRPSGPGTTYPFHGLMDELCFYNRALSQAEIQQIISAGAAGKCNVNSPSPMPPAIVSQPADLSVIAGGTANFTVGSTGCSLSYQWSFNGTKISGATNSTFSLTNVQAAAVGAYSVVVSNSAAAVHSSNAVLTIYTNCISAPPGLVDWWAGEGNAQDVIGGNDGILENGVGFAPGEVGQAFSFDGTNGYIKIPASPTLVDLGQGSGLTIECWIKPTDVSSPHVIAEWDSLSGQSGMQFWTSVVPYYGDPGSIFANFTDTNGGSHTLSSSGGLLTANQFQHVAVTYDKTSGIGVIYINGVVAASANVGPVTLQTTYDLYLGKRDFGSAPSPFSGLMDEISMYNRALSQAQIMDIVRNGSSGKTCVPPKIVAEPLKQVVPPGSNAIFTVSVQGSFPLYYQWYMNGTELAGATNSSFTVDDVQFTNAASYSVTVVNSLGSTNSSVAALEIGLVQVTANNVLLTNAQYSFAGPVTISLQSYYSNAPIFYTLDGSTPSAGSTLYTGPFTVDQSSILQTLAYTPDFTESATSDPISILLVPFYTLSANSAGGGWINVSPTNTNSYSSNTVVAVTAMPSNGWTFLQWTGDAAGTNPTNNVTMSRNKSVQAVFGTTVSAIKTGNGSVAFNPGGGFYPYGASLQVSAVPSAGSYFVLWGNATGGNTNPLTFLVTNANPTISALFTTVGSGQASLTVVPVGHGRVTVNPQANVYPTNSAVTITATPDVGQNFLGWSGKASGMQNPLSLTLSTNETIYANFTLNHTLAGQVGAAGFQDGFVVDLSGEYGTNYELEVSSNLVDWTVLYNLTNTVGTIHYIDTNASSVGERFYRAVVLP